MVVANVDVGVMVSLLGKHGDLLDESHGGEKIRELAVADQFAAGEMPIGVIPEHIFDGFRRSKGSMYAHAA